MKRNIRNFCSRWHKPLTGTLALTLLLSLLAGCGAVGKDPKRALRVGVALYTQDDTFISTVAQNLERKTQETETAQGRKITLSVSDGSSNQTTQLEQVDQFLDRGCDVICVNIVDRTAAAVIIDKAREANVPLIFFNRQPVAEDIRRWENNYYVGARAEESGMLQGQLVLQAWQEQPLDRNGDGILQYVMLEGEPGHQDALLRTEYAVKALTEAGVAVEKLAGGAANWNRAQAAAKMTQWLQEYGESIEVVMANNDDMALGAIDAVRAAGTAMPLVVGVDATAPALEAVAEGTLYGTVLNDAQGMAEAMLELALTLTEGQDPAQTMALQDGHYIWLPYAPVTRDNLADFQ